VLVWVEGRPWLLLHRPAAQRPFVPPKRCHPRCWPRLLPSFTAGSRRLPGRDFPAKPRLSHCGYRDDWDVAEEAGVPALVPPPADGAPAVAQYYPVGVAGVPWNCTALTWLVTRLLELVVEIQQFLKLQHSWTISLFVFMDLHHVLIQPVLSNILKYY